MQIDRRFADYGFTGGFFFIIQLILLCVSGYWPSVFAEIQAFSFPQPADTSIVGPIITGFAGALALIAVFVVGLLLDLLATNFRYAEMRIFTRYLDRNSNWIIYLIEAHKAYCGSDYDMFQSEFHQLQLPTVEQRAFISFEVIFRFWRRESWLRYIKMMMLPLGLSQAPRYERLWSFFTSYIAILSGSAQSSLMVEQYSLWRTARAIGTALQICFLEAFLVGVFMSNALSALDALVAFGVLALTMIFGVWLSIFITKGTYSRLCFTIFSLLYVTYYRQQTEALKDAAPRGLEVRE